MGERENMSINTVQFENQSKVAKPSMDAMLLYSKIDEEYQLEMLSSKQNPDETETRVGWFFEIINGNKEHENYLQLDLRYDDPHHFSGVGTHIGSGETFQIIEGEVNKKTKYWKFIAVYEGGLKKKNEKRLVQHWGWSHGQVWCGGYHDQQINYMDKKLRPYVDQAFYYPKIDNFTL